LKTIIIGLVALVALAVLVSGLFGGSNAGAQPGSRSAAPVEIGSGPLSVDGFWALIDRSAAFESNPDAQVADLRASLQRLTPDQIADFQKLFGETMQNSYSWDLWGVAYLSNGGASDDSFEYFRCWLISKGRRVFEAVSADPDSLADLLATGEGGDLEFEEFAYVARDAWATKTGRDWNDMPVVANTAYDIEPKGSPLIETPEALAHRYPKLWKRFGS
jgi:hypothetical protein